MTEENKDTEVLAAIAQPIAEPKQEDIEFVSTVSTSTPEADPVNTPKYEVQETLTIVSDSDNSDAFVTEKDTFDIKVSYYKVLDDLCVEGVDDEFDLTRDNIKNISITFKYPSQGDYESIMAQNSYKSPDKMTLIDVMQMELTRLVVLIRKWSMKDEFSRMIELNPKIVKAIANKVREKIGVKGIL